MRKDKDKKQSPNKKNAKQKWFEMDDLNKPVLNGKVWVPLRAIKKEQEGTYGYFGYNESFFGLGSIAVPVQDKSEAEKLNWMDVGISLGYSGYCENDSYISSDVYSYSDGLEALNLVLKQSASEPEKTQWHLHQDFVITLDLIREGDIWLSPSEGYIEVARLKRDNSGEPILLEVRAEHLTDYLNARKMGLYATYYFSRRACFENNPKMTWVDGEEEKKLENGKWRGNVREIHEGGNPFGEEVAVFHVSRTDIDDSDDIPNISTPSTEENTISKSWKKGFEGKKLYTVAGEIWKNEWLNPAELSSRVKRDKLPSTIFFITDEKGTKKSGASLIGEGGWLWFKPSVIMPLTHRRGGSLIWYTKDTGSASCSSAYSGVHFGVNQVGLINVFAKDIGMLPEWQQQIWVGHNIAPNGGVSSELLESQAKAEPADTQAPEEFFILGIKTVNDLAKEKLGINLFNQQHSAIPKILKTIHRFRALDDSGLYALAKDISRLTAEDLNTNAIQTIVPPLNANWGSLKSLEHLLASQVGESAKQIMTPLFMVNELRQEDAHLPGSDAEEAFSLLKINRSLPTIFQGHQMLGACVSSIYQIIDILENWEHSTEK